MSILEAICLFWIGTRLDAPIWYYALVIMYALIWALAYSLKLIKLCKDDR
jgi:hypothetical protein